jgi:hypothetical protein
VNRGLFRPSTRGLWQSPWFVPTAGAYQFTHQLGTDQAQASWLLRCVTAEGGYVAGDYVPLPPSSGASGAATVGAAVVLRGGTAVVYVVAFKVINPTSGADVNLTLANWLAQLWLRT